MLTLQMRKLRLGGYAGCSVCPRDAKSSSAQPSLKLVTLLLSQVPQPRGAGASLLFT